MSDRYPGYDVLSKRWSPSWRQADRRVVDQRLAVHPGPRFLDPERFETLKAVCARILPQPKDRPPVPLAALVDEKLHEDRRDGYRRAELPSQGEAWRRGLAALEAEAVARLGRSFTALGAVEQDDLLKAMQEGRLDHPAWDGMACALFFSERVLADIPRAYYAHPTAWSEIGFGGPASERGYVRMDFDRRDPWEAAQARPGRARAAERENRRAGRR